MPSVRGFSFYADASPEGVARSIIRRNASHSLWVCCSAVRLRIFPSG